MSHKQYPEYASLYLDGELNDLKAAELFGHLSECADCRSFMKVGVNLHACITDEELQEVPRSLDERVLAIVSRRQPGMKPRRWFEPVWFTRVSIPLPAVASILLLVVVGSLVLTPLFTREQPPRLEIPPQLVSSIPPLLQRSLELAK